MKQLQKLSDEAVIATALTSARTLPVRHQRSYTSGPSFYLLLVLNLGPEWEWEPADSTRTERLVLTTGQEVSEVTAE